jgi:glycosyltransferase involved in cell wall biosynthesis
MSVYYKENPDYFNAALESLSNQTLKADEVVLVKDGWLTPELEKVIDNYINKLNIRCISLENNVGLGLALQTGILHCQSDLVARMDTDDICDPERFEKQIAFFRNNPDIDVLGSWISEFEDNPNSVYAYRKLPTKHEELLHFAKKRNPMNHVTVIYRRQAVINSGNYQSIIGFEDYYLWAKMLLNNVKFANLPEYLVAVRAGKKMLDRRGGLKYCINEISLQQEFMNLGFINIMEFVRNLSMRLPIFLMPNRVRQLVYQYALRDKL